MLIMPNPWIEHVKTYAKEHNITYGEAISQAKETYVKKERQSGGSRNSNIVRVLEGKKKLNINKVKNPSKHLLNKYKKSTKLTRSDFKNITILKQVLTDLPKYSSFEGKDKDYTQTQYTIEQIQKKMKTHTLPIYGVLYNKIAGIKGEPKIDLKEHPSRP